ncbi:MAG: tRNA (N(6)-L-threonylcarbamoyladenosine(37)-C(2))-methylthiotransferase MtaB [Clostridiaceae bacterium]
MKVAFETLGCRVNIYDSEAMLELFRKDGYEAVPFESKADVYVINTCTVTNTGDKKSRQMIRRARRMNPEAVIAVVGCYSQIAPEEIAAIDGVDIVLGSRNKSRVVELANRSLATGERIVEVSDVMTSHEFEPLNVSDFEDKTRAFLKIQDGCNRFCTYCMIPYARGGISSKSKDVVLREIHQLVEAGFQEVILSGIHIASYGLDKPEQGVLLGSPNYGLMELLEDLERIEGLKRIRIGSIEPMFFKGDRLERIARLSKLCPHFHLSLQSGSDSVLKRMNRRYTTQEYEEVVNALRDRIPQVSITTDLITGFPGETEEEHNETMVFLKRLRLTKTHVFKYSPRAGTTAAGMPHQVSPADKDRRSHELTNLSDEMEEQFNAGLVGTIQPVLFEKSESTTEKGLTGNFVEVLVETKVNLAGQIRKVRILSSDSAHCRGILLDES